MNLPPPIMITNADLAMDAAIAQTYPLTQHLHFDYMALQEDREVNCEIACLNGVFDLPQVKASTIFCKYRMSNNSINESYSLTKWTPILSTDVYGFSDKKIELELTQFHLNKKQCYAKVFELARTLVNKKEHLQGIQHIPSSSEGNQQSSAIRKNRYNIDITESKSESDSDSDNFVTEHHSKRARNDVQDQKIII
ncbi:4386_t:CDS:2 [Gigaspora rosea]|nr:4386_t:CDS:2 [Gigaspora rosea]